MIRVPRGYGAFDSPGGLRMIWILLAVVAGPGLVTIMLWWGDGR